MTDKKAERLEALRQSPNWHESPIDLPRFQGGIIVQKYLTAIQFDDWLQRNEQIEELRKKHPRLNRDLHSEFYARQPLIEWHMPHWNPSDQDLLQFDYPEMLIRWAVRTTEESIRLALDLKN